MIRIPAEGHGQGGDAATATGCDDLKVIEAYRFLRSVAGGVSSGGANAVPGFRTVKRPSAGR
jgi:hypothetical protein